MSKERARDVELAVSEAATNALLAHVRTGSRDALVLQLIDHQGMLEASVRDTGSGFVPRADHATPGDDLPVSGRGVPLMRMLADDVHYSNGRGTTLQLFFVVDGPWRDTPRSLADRPCS
jgi:anti-sigma regulatory factor (Ser/Thr protein kinase)